MDSHSRSTPCLAFENQCCLVVLVLMLMMLLMLQLCLVVLVLMLLMLHLFFSTVEGMN